LFKYLPYIIAPAAIVVGYIGFHAEEYIGGKARIDKVRVHVCMHLRHEQAWLSTCAHLAIQ
jgi:hypothetical protein